MFCWKCGKEIADGSQFCPFCGSRLQAEKAQSGPVSGGSQVHQAPPQMNQQAPYTYGNGQAQKPKKKKTGVLVAILVAVAVLIAARAVGYQTGRKLAGSYIQNSSSAKTDVKPEEIREEDIKEALNDLDLTDLLSQNKAVMIEDEAGGRTIAIVYYGADSHILTGLTMEYVLDVSDGYTLDILQESDLESKFPGFAECSYDEKDGHVIFTAKMTDLKEPDRVKQLAEYDLIELEESDDPAALDADTLIDSFYEYGWTDVGVADLSLLQY